MTLRPFESLTVVSSKVEGREAQGHPEPSRGLTAWAAREHHRFEAAGKPFVYLVPSAAIFALDEAADAVLRTVSRRPHTRDELAAVLAEDVGAELARSRGDLDATLEELARVRAIGEVTAEVNPRRGDDAPMPRIIPLAPFPLTTMVLNVTNQCNLSCEYC